MPCNLLESVRKKLGLPMFIPEAYTETERLEAADTVGTARKKLAQGTVLAILVALYEAARTRDGVKAIADMPMHTDWTNVLFQVNRQQMINYISAYSSFDIIHIEQKLREAAETVIGIIRDFVSKDDKYKYSDIKELLLAQRFYIVPYLPASLHLNSVLHDHVLDD